jgi:site-specific recombinase XerD
MTPIAPHIEAFLREHLGHHRGASQHTCDSYASSFQLLFEFAAKKLKMAPSALTLEQLNAELISAFLENLEDVRRNSPETRNIRLAAIRSFFRFLEHREPTALEQIRRALAIPYKKTNTRLVPYLGQEAVQALLDAPDPTTREGIRDRAMLHLAVCGGLRVSELTGLRIEDLGLSSKTILVHGKGRRERALPLWKTTAKALRAWLAVRGKVATPELFVNARGGPMSRWGFAYVLEHHAKTGQVTNAHRCRISRFRRMCLGTPVRWSCSKPPRISAKSRSGWAIVICQPLRSIRALIPRKNWRPSRLSFRHICGEDHFDLQTNSSHC